MRSSGIEFPTAGRKHGRSIFGRRKLKRSAASSRGRARRVVEERRSLSLLIRPAVTPCLLTGESKAGVTLYLTQAPRATFIETPHHGSGERGTATGRNGRSPAW